MSLASLSICNDERYLQQEPWAFGHEREGPPPRRHRGGRRRWQTHANCGTGRLTPCWSSTLGKEEGGWGRARTPRHCERPHLEPINGQLLPPPEGEWAGLGMSHRDQLSREMANNSAERKRLAINTGWGWGWRCMYISGQTNCKDQGQWIWRAVLSPADSWAGYPVYSFRLLWTLASGCRQEPAPRGPHRLATWSIGSPAGLDERNTGKENRGWDQGSGYLLPFPPRPPAGRMEVWQRVCSSLGTFSWNRIS